MRSCGSRFAINRSFVTALCVSEKHVKVVNVQCIRSEKRSVEIRGVAIDDIYHCIRRYFKVAPSDWCIRLELLAVEKILLVEVTVELIATNPKTLEYFQRADCLAIVFDRFSSYRNSVIKHPVVIRISFSALQLCSSPPLAVVLNKCEEVEKTTLSLLIE